PRRWASIGPRCARNSPCADWNNPRAYNAALDMPPGRHGDCSSMADSSIVPIRHALLSVSDKAGVVELARGLDAHDVALISTGGTARALREAGLPVTDVSDVTGFPGIMDGRVKTLHPKIHGGLLGRRGMDDDVMR